MDLDDVLNQIGGFDDTIPNETPELRLYRELTEGKPYPKFHNCIYWLKHELYVYKHLQDKNWHVSKISAATGRPSGQISGLARTLVSYKELTRAFLEYYFQMTMLPRFEGEDAKRRGLAPDMDKFLDIVMEHELVKKLIENPHLLV